MIEESSLAREKLAGLFFFAGFLRPWVKLNMKEKSCIGVRPLKKSSIIIGAVVIYIIIMAAGIGAYFYFDQQQKLHQEQLQAQRQREDSSDGSPVFRRQRKSRLPQYSERP